MEKHADRYWQFGSNYLPDYQGCIAAIGDFAVRVIEFLSSPAYVKNIVLVVIVFTLSDQLGWYAGRKSAEKTAGAMAFTAPKLSDKEKQMMARFHENYLRLKADDRIANSSPR